MKASVRIEVPRPSSAPAYGDEPGHADRVTESSLAATTHDDEGGRADRGAEHLPRPHMAVSLDTRSGSPYRRLRPRVTMKVGVWTASATPESASDNNLARAHDVDTKGAPAVPKDVP